MHLDPATLATVRHALQLIRLAMFAGFIVAGVRVIYAKPPHRRRAINHLIVYILAAQAAIAIAQNEAWPFTMYPMMAVDASDHISPHHGLSFRVVDAAGREWPLDPLAWSPLYPQSVMGWFETGYPHADFSQRTSAMRFLLERCELARAKRAGHARFYGNASVLGPLAAPDTNLYGEAPQSALPLRTLRVYRLVWSPAGFARDGRVMSRTLIGEYSR
jgi:hypothetical protein